ncbi:MAG: apolipoprotein N-acyltransferase [Desulfobacterales bacterium]
MSVKKAYRGISKRKKEIFLSVLSGLLLTCSFPKVGADWVAWFSLVPMLFALQSLPPGRAFCMGLTTGTVHYLTLLYWLIPMMEIYGGIPLWLGTGFIFLLALYLGLYVAAFSAILKRFCIQPVGIFFLIPVLIVSFEYLRSFLFSGFPWELLGYSQYNRLPLIQISDITGVYGVSFLIALVNGAFLIVLLHLTRVRWQNFPVSKKVAAGSAGMTVLVVAAVLLYGNQRIKTVDELQAGSPAVKISVIQGNIDQSKKWEHSYQQETVEKYIRMSLSTSSESPELIVWPETATPFYFLSRYHVDLTRLIQEGVKRSGAFFLVGSPSYERNNHEIEYYNSAYLLNPEGESIGKYSKVHLVPYGEYIPLKKWIPFLGKLVAQVGDFKPGKKGSTLKWGENRIGIQICFEVIFPELARAMAKNRAALFVNITNDAWFGTSSGPHQHFSMTIFRSVENKRALVRSANTGISGFIDPCGRILSKTSLSTEATLTQTVPFMEIKTIYMIAGDLFALICLLSATLFIVFRFIKKN